jgi:hypothetical protein
VPVEQARKLPQEFERIVGLTVSDRELHVDLASDLPNSRHGAIGK